MSLAEAASLAEAPLRQVTIEEWHRLYGDYEGGRCELVRGHPIMTPTEATQNGRAISRLMVLLDAALSPSWEPLTNTSVQTTDPAPTVRVPDIVVLRADRIGPEWLMLPSDIALAVEVVSPSSVETDWVTKRAEYAAAGIPSYLIIDVRFADGPRLWLFDQLTAGGGGGTTTYPGYPDPTGDGTTVTLRIPGYDPITITAADLL